MLDVGRPSSVATAFNAADDVGRVIDVGLADAVTVGAALVGGGGGGGGGGAGLTTTDTSALPDSWPSLTVIRNTNVPSWLKVTVVAGTFSLSNAIPSGPLTRDHL